MRIQSKPTNLPKARENAGDQVVIGLSIASDWLREWHEFSGPIKARSKAKTKQSQITLDTQLKIFLHNGINLIRSQRENSTANCS